MRTNERKKNKFRKVVEYEDLSDTTFLWQIFIGFLIVGLLALFDKTKGEELVNMFVAGSLLTISLMAIILIVFFIIWSREVYWEKIE